MKFNKSFSLGRRMISEDHPPFIVAEISANHNGSLKQAKDLIMTAAHRGAHAVKMQSYTADTMTLQCGRKDFQITQGPWAGYNLYDLYKEAQTPFEWHHDLFEFAKQNSITLFSTPFDETALELLERLGAPAYKIASFELTDTVLLEEVAKLRKPVFISTGMADPTEIGEALEIFANQDCRDLLVFHCVSSYPAPYEQASLRTMQWLKDEFNVLVGLSDHTLGNAVPVAAAALGAAAIEKHFIRSRGEGGLDSAFSIEPSELEELVQQTQIAFRARGEYTPPVRLDCEAASIIFRRSLYFSIDLKKGDIVTEGAIRRVRPGYGLSIRRIKEVIGSRVTRDIFAGEPVTEESLENI